MCKLYFSCNECKNNWKTTTNYWCKEDILILKERKDKCKTIGCKGTLTFIETSKCERLKQQEKKEEEEKLEYIKLSQKKYTIDPIDAEHSGLILVNCKTGDLSSLADIIGDNDNAISIWESFPSYTSKIKVKNSEIGKLVSILSRLGYVSE